jgi:predicted adenine nucleotide alpha hydrolase (AANH) superfamily ATPase
LERLKDDYELAVFFYGPNIHPQEEYQTRLADMRQLCLRVGVELIEDEYDPATWEQKVSPYEHLPEGSRRCETCFDLRMEKTARVAKTRLFDYFTVTLTVSRHKNSKLIMKVGKDVEKRVGINYLAEDFKKKDGFNLSLCRSRELGLRRQDYCGCRLSLDEAQQRQKIREGDNR